jgi:hypothetical protein
MSVRAKDFWGDVAAIGERRRLGPGMESSRRCSECGGDLSNADELRCQACRPQLSAQAQAVGAARRERDEQIAALEQEVARLALTIKKVEKRLSWHIKSSKTRPTSGKSS